MSGTERLQQLTAEQRRRLEERLLARAAETTSAERAVAPRADDSVGTGPLSPAQQGVWLGHQVDPTGCAYNLPMHTRITGPLDTEAFITAFGQVVRWHPPLRASLSVDEAGNATQRVTDTAVALRVEDLRALSASDRVRLTEEHADEMAGRPFDLTTAPLVRARLLVLSDDERLLLLVAHHLIVDGGSARIILRDLVAAYRAIRAGRPPAAVDRPEYLDVVRRQRESGGRQGAADLEYWRARLSAHSGRWEAPADLPGGGRPTARARRVPLRIADPLAGRLRAVAGAHHSSLFMVVLAAIASVTGRFSRQEEVVIGAAVDHRDLWDAQEVVGLFADFLPLGVHLPGTLPFQRLLEQVRDTALDALSHGNVSFDEIVRVSGMERVSGRSPIFQLAFTFQDEPVHDPQGGDIRLDYANVGASSTRFDFTFCLVRVGAGLEGYVEYDAARYRRETADVLARQLHAFLVAAVDDPSRAVGRLPIIDAEERARLSVVPTVPGATAFVPVHERFRESARAHGERTAVICAGGGLTYRELDERSDRLAAVLRAAGAGPETRVAFALPDGDADAIVAMLGILKSGGAYVPLDPAHPAARLARLLESSGAALVVTSATAPAPPLAAEVIRADASAPAETTPVPGPVVRARSLAYVLFTSGSTGEPKGVAVEHGNLSAYVSATMRAFGFRPGMTHLITQSLTVDSPLSALWPALLSGGTVRLASGADLMSRSFADSPPDHLKITPSCLSALSGMAVTELLVVGGEPASLELLRPYHTRGCRVINNYGLTETTVGGLLHELRGDEATGTGWAPIGTALPGGTAYLLDERLEPVPSGAIGEICVGGPCVTRGYAGRPDLTARTYVPDPFSATPGARLVRTGDLGRRLPDGSIEWLRRADDQVKVRGHRVEPAELEAALTRQDGVAAAVAVLDDTRTLDAALVGYAVPERGRILDTDALLDALRGELPGYLVPETIVELGEVPRTPGGKILRAALPRPLRRSAPAPEATEEDPMVDLMGRLWAKVLEVDRVGPDDDYLNLGGGNSLNATRLVIHIRKAFGVEVPMREVLDRRTVRELVRLVRALTLGGSVAPDAVREIQPGDLAGDLPLSAAQRGMWVVSELDRESPRWVVPIALYADGPLDLAAFGGALTHIVRRHTVLRSTFPVVDGRPRQRVQPPRDVLVETNDLSDGSATDPEDAARQWLLARMAEPLDIVGGPVLRAFAAKVSSRRWMVLVNIHHIAFDRWSRENFCAELSECYRAMLAGEPPRLEPLPIQYADFARWQNDWLEGAESAAHLAYWRGQLEDPPAPIELRFQRPRPRRRERRGQFVPFEIAAEVGEGIRAVCGAEGVTPFMVLFAAFQAALRRAGAGTDFVVGVPVGNRADARLEPLMGLLVNTLAVRADISGEPDFRELLRRVRRRTMEAYAHQDYPFDQIVEELRPRRESSRDPIFDVMFTYQNVPAGTGLNLPGVTLTSMPLIDEWVAKRDLTVRIEEADGVYGVCEYDAELFGSADVVDFVDGYVHLLTEAVHDLSLPVPTEETEKRMSSEDDRVSAYDKFQKLTATKPTKVRAGAGDTVRTGSLSGDRPGLPFLVEARRPGVDLVEWLDGDTDLVDAKLAEAGGILFRGFHVGSPAEFRAFASAAIERLLDYNERSTPRSQAGEPNVFTSTEYPPDQHIEQHNELAYTHTWPYRIAFYCHEPAATGGATPVADSRAVYRRLAPRVRERFERMGVMYVRNYGTGVDLPWQEAFQTEERADVERYCRSAGIAWEWRDDDVLRTRQVRQAAIAHPATGDPLWFNSAHMFHVAGLAASVRDSLVNMFGEDGLPRHAYYGDGSPIDDETIHAVREAYRAETVTFPWRERDVLLLDNMLASHGRWPYEGRRRVLVAFGDPVGVTGAVAGLPRAERLDADGTTLGAAS